MHDVAIQDRLRDNFCWGCGADNPDGLHLKSYWDGRAAVATFVPADMFAAGPRHVLNGGIVATLLDCHGVCAAIAQAYDAACTPDFFLFDKDLKLVYRGQLDDSRPGNTTPVSGRDLRLALDAVIAARPVSADQRPSIGCNIKWKP